MITIVDYWADWCGPCKVLEPVLMELVGENKIALEKVDIETLSEEEKDELNLRAIPTLDFKKNGVVVSRIVGAATKARLIEEIETLS